MSTYTLWCLIEGDNVPFRVTPLSTISIDELKKDIKNEDPIRLEKVVSKDLILYKIDVNVNADHEVEDQIRTGQYKPDVTGQKPLWNPDSLSTIWSEPPPDGHLHIFVGLPIGLSPNLVQPGDESTRDLRAAVTLRTPSQREFEAWETLGLNSIFELQGTEPDFLIDLRDRLVQHRWIESSTEDFVVSPLKNKLQEFDDYFQPAPADAEQRDRVSSELSLFHLAFAFIDVAWKEGTIKEANVRWIFDKLGCYARSILGGRESHAFYGDWLFKLVVDVADENKKYRYTPRSDFRISVDRLNYLLVEVQSDKDQKDRYRMLLQAACAARLGRQLYGNPFIVMALYIENGGHVTRYFVFQRHDKDQDENLTVSYVEDVRDWTKPFELFEAMFEIYNLLSIIQSDRPRVENMEQQIRLLTAEISNYPQTLNSKRTHSDSNGDARNSASPERRSRRRGPKEMDNIGLDFQCVEHVFLDGQVVEAFTQTGYTSELNDEDECGEHVYQDRQVVEAFTQTGYTLESNGEDEKGWAPMNQLKPTMRHAKQSNGTTVVVKLLHSGSDELWILQHLQSTKSPFNHTIPLLRTLKLNVGTFVLLPSATPLDLGFKFGKFRSEVVDLSRQLIEGVAFLHRSGIAHLDIKPANIVVLRNRLFIIDFDISVCVDGPDALIDRWCGTPGWMAPEIGHQDGPRRLYSPIRADLWSSGRVLQYLAAEGDVKEYWIEAQMRLLLNRYPPFRPLLHPQSSDTVGHPLKRKADIPPPYAKRLAISTIYT